MLSITSTKPGAAGSGGQGGFKGTSKSSSVTSNSFSLPSGYTYCSGGGSSPTPVNICDCDSVFWALSSSAASNVFKPSRPAPTHYFFTNYDVYVKYDTGEVHLYSKYIGGNITSHCYLYSDTQCIPMFDKMKNDLALPSNWGQIDLQNYAAQRVSTSPLVVTFNKDGTSHRIVLQWVSADGVLYDVMEPGVPACYKGSCDSKDPENRTREVADGTKNNDGEQASLTESNDEKNIGLFESWPEYVLNLDDGTNKPNNNIVPIHGATVRQAVSSLIINIPNPMVQEVKYIIIDALGQTLKSGTMLDVTNRNVSIEGLASGVYNLLLFSQNSNFVYKFVVTN